jgi:hypothetical protein
MLTLPRRFTVALAAALSVTCVAQAGDGRPKYNPFGAAGRAPVCTAAELKAGIEGGECGQGRIRATAAQSDKGEEAS